MFAFAIGGRRFQNPAILIGIGFQPARWPTFGCQIMQLGTLFSRVGVRQSNIETFKYAGSSENHLNDQSRTPFVSFARPLHVFNPPSRDCPGVARLSQRSVEPCYTELHRVTTVLHRVLRSHSVFLPIEHLALAICSGTYCWRRSMSLQRWCDLQE